MARRFREEIEHWKDGAYTNGPPDKISLNATPRAYNTAWIGNGVPAKRKGCALLTQWGETDNPEILALGHFNDINWTISSEGTWNKIIPEVTYGLYESVYIDAGITNPFTVTDYPSTAIGENLLFAVNGTDALKTDGTDITNFGIVAPTGHLVVDSAVAGNPNGTYSVGVSGYNSATGHESSMGVPITLAVVNTRIDVAFAAPADAQITHWRVHIFKTGLTDRFFRLTNTNVANTLGAYSANDGGWTVATSSIRINVTDADINNLIVQSPGQHENDPPPDGCRAILYHGSRMFATDGVDLWYSKDGFPESFDPDTRVEHVNRKDGQAIVAMASLSEHHIVIFKENSCYVLTGPDDPNTWEIQELDTTVGLKSLRSLIKTNRGLWWEGDQGFFRIEPSKYPVKMDSPNISDRLEGSVDSNGVVCAYDGIRERVLFALPSTAGGENDIILPFNERLGLWEDIWDPFNVSAMGTFYDDDHVPYVVLGGYNGRLYQLWANLPPYLDGVRADDGVDSFTLTGHPTEATDDTLTDADATFDTDGDALKGAILLAVTPAGTVQRRIIESNTSTEITLTTNFAAIPDETYTYYIGCPNWEFDTKYMAPTNAPVAGSIFNSRKFKRCLVKGMATSGAATMDVYAIVDHITFDFAAHVQVVFEGSGAIFDIDLFDIAIFGTQRAKVSHKTLGVSGRVCGLRLVNREPSTGATLLGLGIMGTEHGHKE